MQNFKDAGGGGGRSNNLICIVFSESYQRKADIKYVGLWANS